MEGMANLATSGALARAVVSSVWPDGTVVVATYPDRALDVLATGQGSPSLVEGDEVFVWVPLHETERGVVIGRIGLSQAAEVSPDTLVLQANDRIILRVGDGSIEMRSDGKILIKGTDLVSHAKRMNRIKGGAVSIN